MTGTSDKVKLTVEIGSALAVLLGLVFVGLELRQNTAAVEAATFQSLTDASSNYLLTVAGDPELSRLLMRAEGDLSGLDEVEASRLFLVNRSYWVRMQNVFSQWRRGTLSDDDWELYREVICGSRGSGIDANRAVRETFAQHAPLLSPNFREYVQSCWDESSTG